MSGAEVGEKRAQEGATAVDGSSKPSAPAPSMDKAARKARFEGVFPKLVKEIIDHVRGENMPKDMTEWYERSLMHNTMGGKLNRGMSVVDTVEILKGSYLTDEEYFQAATLGWCVELLQSMFLIADDIMDQSVTRRGAPCWYKTPGVGNIAINDSFMVEAAIYFLLKKHFRSQSYYLDLVELFLETTFQTEMGQQIDLLTAPEDDVDLSRFSMEKHHLIVVYKTAFYSFYLPVALAMHMSKVTNESAYKQALSILLVMGEYFQIQDDYLDCYGDPAYIGKIGTDILDGKASWNANIALQYGTPEQKKIMEENYGKKDAEAEAKIKKIFSEAPISIPERFEKYEKESYDKITALIEEIDEEKTGLKKQVFVSFLAKVYKRDK